MRYLSNSIKDIYGSAKIPTVDLEKQINHAIDRNKKGKVSFKTVLIAAVIITLSTVITFATVTIKMNQDRSRTLVDNETNNQFTLSMDDNNQKFDKEEEQASKDIVAAVYHIKPEGDQARVVYYDYSHEKEPIVWITAADDRFKVVDDDYSELLTHDKTPTYLETLITSIKSDFEVLSGTYSYQVDETTRLELIESVVPKSTFGEIYVELRPVEKQLWGVSLKLLTKDVERFHSTSIAIYNSSVFSSPGYEGSSFESVMVNDQEAMMSKRSNGAYILVAEVNGYFINFEAKAEKEDMIEFVEKVTKVLEKY